ncbi:MAG: SpoIIE family protein phosphatase [Candidatus Eisenbacteria bacterium]|nr:SpoIIE family protein phosphatase [Candidatus Eisenbacteria bacterium]
MNGERHPRRGGFAFRALVFFAPFLILYGLSGYATIDRLPDYGMRQRLFQVLQVDAGRPADRAGLLPGDRIVELNGIPIDDTIRLFSESARIRPGDEVTFKIRRGEETREVTLSPDAHTRDHRLGVLARGLTGIAFLLVGLLVLWNRSDRIGRTFYLAGACFAITLFEPPATGSTIAQYGIKILRDAAFFFLAPLFLRFFLLFPREKRIPRWLVPLRPWPAGAKRPLSFPLFGISLILWIASSLISLQVFIRGRADVTLFGLLQFLGAIFIFSCLIGGIASFFHSWARTKTPALRSRLRWVVAGTVIPLGVLAVVNVVQQVNPEIMPPGRPFYPLLLIILPISFAHAIVRYGLFDFELILKRSILYTLLTTFLAMSYLVFVELLSRLLRDVAGNTDIPATLVSLFLLALLFSPARDRIQRWVDRTFYPEKHAYRRTLQEFSTAVTTILDLETLVPLMAQRISSSLRIPKVAVFLPGDDLSLDLRAETGFGAIDPARFRFSEGERVLEMARSSADVLPVEQMLHHGGAEPLSLRELTRLQELDTSHLLPLHSGKSLVGLISLGRKSSQEVFSHEDRQLLKIFAAQAALAIENAKLHRNTIVQEKMQQEMRLAREIQKQFLPSAPPRIPSIEVAAINDPCEEIGGDYYDYVDLGGRSFGVAIGDAAGSGVTAALLMASLQASFRAEAVNNHSPSDVLHRINNFTFQRTHTARFVTFFYGLIDLKSGLFRYANAGHNPPILVGADGSSRFLTESDLILGVDADVVYHEHALQLRSGDLVVLFTDGVTDELNAEDESFGEERLRDLIVRHRDLPAAELIERILVEVRDFMGDDPGDDVTLLALRYHPGH